MAIKIIPFSENGGFAATTFFLFMPCQASDTGQPFVSVFDPTSFDDVQDASSYSYRSEDVEPARYPVIRRVILVYTDLGVATIGVTISGTNDNNAAVSATVQAKIGTAGASGQLLTAFIDIGISCFRPQLTISRAAGGGPVSIVSATLVGEVEEASL